MSMQPKLCEFNAASNQERFKIQLKSVKSHIVFIYCEKLPMFNNLLKN